VTNITDHYEKVLEFICKLEDVDDLAHLFEYLDNFWQTQFGTAPVLIYSRNKKRKSQLRDYWNKGKEKIYYDKKELSLFSSLVLASKDDDGFSFQKEGDDLYYVLNCGEFKGQDFFVCFKITEEITAHIINYLIQFLKTTLTKISRYKEADTLKSLIHVDDVTGLYNQRKFVIDIEASIEEYDKFTKPFSVVFIDIDHFKQVNDGHGHLVGTQLLKDVARIIKDTVRDEDLCYRYGGDEFVLIIPLSTYKEAKVVGARVLKNIKEETFFVNDGINGSCEFKLSVSVGIASFPHDAKTKTEIINMADKMMYKAKQSGRGKVCHAGELFSDEELTQ